MNSLFLLLPPFLFSLTLQSFKYLAVMNTLDMVYHEQHSQYFAKNGTKIPVFQHLCWYWQTIETKQCEKKHNFIVHRQSSHTHCATKLCRIGIKSIMRCAMFYTKPHHCRGHCCHTPANTTTRWKSSRRIEIIQKSARNTTAATQKLRNNLRETTWNLLDPFRATEYKQ